ncbi:ParB/RepB/Spo0J family partition protein [Lachnospiraceae bacterium MD329]|nr:ParB/RepB/Spo0J family partition protein [Lachnospiraceae bacterium MD329]
MIKTVNITELKPYEAQPYKVLMDESMNELAESISENGLFSPVVVRPHKDGGYEILSGHRRVQACNLAGIEDIPIEIRELNDDNAAIFLVDSNLHRENILPSEKAFAYKLKLEAMKRQGKRMDLTSRQFVGKLESANIIGVDVAESGRQIQRYIRLTNLITPILDLVDQKQIALNAAVELSYLSAKQQAETFKAIKYEQTAPSISQAKRIRKFADNNKLLPEVIEAILQEEKPEKLKLNFDNGKIRRYFPKNYSQRQMEDTIMRLLENWYKRRNKNMER